ncbi:MAG TPA: Ig-like domain-containing protein [Geothermobacteraceae bacterium]|nr:Ig-like domain-containing protein [Geothermobacteraceae bacterium]
MNTRLLTRLALAWTLIVLMLSPAFAGFNQLGAPIEPHGFPEHYRDDNGVELMLCLDGDGVNGLCFFDPIDPANADSVALQVGGESFYWLSEASTRPLVAGGKAVLVMALEAAFAGGDAKNGDQMTFGRIRIRVDVPVPGTYTVTHPFGTEVFENVTVADGINSTIDIGAINVLDPALGFEGALDAQVGPFLTWPDYELDPTLQVLDVDGVTVLTQYVGDPGVPHVVTGSPIVDATHLSGFQNYFRVEGPEGSDLISETDLFTVMGKVNNTVNPVAFTFPPPPEPTLFAVGPVNRSGPLAAGDPLLQPDGIRLATQVDGYPIGFPVWYQERILDPNPPNGTDTGGVQLTICQAVDPMCLSAPVDPSDPESVALNVGEEAFWWTGEAFINDRTEDVPDPQGLDAILVLALEGAFAGGPPLEGDQMGFARIRIRIDTPLAGLYTVTHPYGTEVFENVEAGPRAINITRDIMLIDRNNPDPAFVGALLGDIGPNFLKWDTYNNDSGLTDAALIKPFSANDPTPVYYIGDPTVPHAVVGSPTGNNLFRVQGPGGIDVTTSLFNISGRIYDPATFAIVPDVGAPVAQDDAATVESGGSVIVDILANDTLAGVPIVPADSTVTLSTTTVPVDGSVQLNQDGTVTYTSTTPGFAGTDSFAYTVTDNAGGLTSNTATATVTVTPVETIAVTRAQFDRRRLQWEIRGTDNIDGLTITVHAGQTAAGPVIGTALVNGGNWQLRTRATSNPGVTSISVVSSSGATLLNQSLRIR